MATRPGLEKCLFDAGTQTRLIERVMTYVREKGVVTATPLFGNMPPQESSFNISGHQTSQNFLRDTSECTVDTLRFDLLANDLKTPLTSGDPIFCTWVVRMPPPTPKGLATDALQRYFGYCTYLPQYGPRLSERRPALWRRSTLTTLTNAWQCTSQARSLPLLKRHI